MNVRNLVLAAFGLTLLPSIACTKILGIDKDYVEASGSGASTATGTGGSTNTSSTTGMHTGGSGGTTAMVSCMVPTDCPGVENECAHRTCVAGLCGADFTPQGTRLGAQSAGDCKEIVCDGKGNPEQRNDDEDVPNDSNPCSNDLCAAGVASHTPAAFGMSCGTGLTCDGNGNCTGCVSPGDCPGQDSDCQARACTSGICGFVYAPAGTPVSSQTAGDCKLNVCNGMGQVSVIASSSDPSDDGNACTIDGCSNGSPTNTNTAAGAPCNSMGGQVCDGAGSCVACLVADTCPGQNDECRTRTCSGGKCGMTFTSMGTMVALQAAGDCKKNVCDGAGGVIGAADNGDVPDDGNPCTNDGCSNGAVVFDPAPNGLSCGPNKTCNGVGQCVGCIAATDCPGTDNACQSRTCTSGVCGMTYVTAGTLAGKQSAGDCKHSVCDGMGATVVLADDSDVPNDGDPCTSDVCSNGTPSNPPAPAGTSCSGGYCNGSGVCGECVPGDFRDCCSFMGTFCCNQRRAHNGPSIESVSKIDEVPDQPCCCYGTETCDSSGQWSGCF